MSNCLGFIGGSGLYELDFLENKKFLEMTSPWGNPSDKIIKGSIEGNDIFFLSRHGLGHKLSPTSINYSCKYRLSKTMRSNRYYFSFSSRIFKRIFESWNFCNC